MVIFFFFLNKRLEIFCGDFGVSGDGFPTEVVEGCGGDQQWWWDVRVVDSGTWTDLDFFLI